MAPLDPVSVVGIVAIINAVFAGIALIIAAWFAAHRPPPIDKPPAP